MILPILPSSKTDLPVPSKAVGYNWDILTTTCLIDGAFGS